MDTRNFVVAGAAIAFAFVANVVYAAEKYECQHVSRNICYNSKCETFPGDNIVEFFAIDQSNSSLFYVGGRSGSSWSSYNNAKRSYSATVVETSRGLYILDLAGMTLTYRSKDAEWDITSTFRCRFVESITFR